MNLKLAPLAAAMLFTAGSAGQAQNAAVDIAIPPPPEPARTRPAPAEQRAAPAPIDRPDAGAPERVPERTSTPERAAAPPAPIEREVEVVPVPVEVGRPAPPVSSDPIDLSADAPYPNGFGDPLSDPYADDPALAARAQDDGFDWGLLGLLGLFGLLGLRRRAERYDRYDRQVYAERSDEGPGPGRRGY